MAKKKKAKGKLHKKVKRFREDHRDRKRERDLASKYEADQLGHLETTTEKIGGSKRRSDTRLEIIQLTEQAFREHGFVSISGLDEVSENGRVLEILGPMSKIQVGDEVLQCDLHMELRAIQSADKNFLVVGDKVYVEKTTEESDFDGTILAVFRRDSWLSRASSRKSHVELVIASNVDQMCIVASIVEPDIRLPLIDRFLVAAHVGNLDPFIVINKIDLITDKGLELVRDMMAPYVVLGYPILYVSAVERKNLDGMRGIMANKSTLFTGHSGVGKSALINAIDPRYKRKIGEISNYTGKGKHTTSRATLLPLRFGGYVVDTPGIRSFSIWEVPRNELALYYREMKDLAPNCRYPGCTHTHEPECAVKEALAEGKIHPTRYENYLKIYESLDEIPPA